MATTTFPDGSVPEVLDVVRLASFQLQADTGRGVAGKRPLPMTPDAVARQIEEGAGTSLNFDTPVGHARCNRYAAGLVAGTPVKVFGVPQGDGSLKAYVIVYFTGTLPRL